MGKTAFCTAFVIVSLALGMGTAAGQEEKPAPPETAITVEERGTADTGIAAREEEAGAERAETAPESFFSSLYVTLSEGVTVSWLTRIINQTGRSNFVFRDFLAGAYVQAELRNFMFVTPVARLAAYYPLVSTFNLVEQKPKVPLHFGTDFTLGFRLELDFIEYLRITLGPAMHLFFLDSERWRYWNLGAAGMAGVEVPIAARWTLLMNGLISLDNGNLGANRKMEPFDLVFQYQIDIAVRYSKKLRNRFSSL